MTIVSAGDTLALRYALRANGVEVVSNFDEPAPDTLTLGDGTLAPALEFWLIGVAPGERHVFLLEPAQAFGERDAEKIRPVERRTLPPEFVIQPETMIEFELQDGSPLPGVIIEVTPEHAVVDFNHPLAGMKIEFEVEIEAILPPAPAA